MELAVDDLILVTVDGDEVTYQFDSLEQLEAWGNGALESYVGAVTATSAELELNWATLSSLADF